MKRFILLLVFMLCFSSAYAIKNPFASCPKIEKPKQCFHRIKISPQKEYVYAYVEGVIKQVAVIFNSTRTIVFLNESQKPTGWKTATGPNGFAADKEINFKCMLDIELQNFREEDFK